MENRNNVRYTAMVPVPSLPATPERAVLSVNGSLRMIVREMRVLETSYPKAIREFQECYIVAVLIKHACHLGRTAEDLGMHRNTLTRILRNLDIDPKQIRKLMRSRLTDRAPVGNYVHSVWGHLGESEEWNSESPGPRPNIGARAGA